MQWEDYLRGAWQPLGENKKAFFIVLFLTKGQFKIRNIHASKERDQVERKETSNGISFQTYCQ
jgi:hypothetical protein